MDWEAQRTSFGEFASAYDAYRPEWPAATAAWLTGTEDGGPAAGAALDVLDLGAGTGKLTRSLVAAGHRVTAVDVSDGMLAVLAARLPEVRTVQASAEELPLPDASFDVVTVAQAWHWFDPSVVAAQCARVLRPGGQLAVGWHLHAPAEPLDAQVRALVGSSEYQDRSAIQNRTALELPAPFAEIERTTFDHELRTTPEGLAAVVSTWSYVAVREDRDQVLAAVEQVGHRVADAEGMVTMPHITYCYRARR
jgi:SAM-dependent methyltransferase